MAVDEVNNVYNFSRQNTFALVYFPIDGSARGYVFLPFFRPFIRGLTKFHL